MSITSRLVSELANKTLNLVAHYLPSHLTYRGCPADPQTYLSLLTDGRRVERRRQRRAPSRGGAPFLCSSSDFRLFFTADDAASSSNNKQTLKPLSSNLDVNYHDNAFRSALQLIIIVTLFEETFSEVRPPPRLPFWLLPGYQPCTVASSYFG